MIERLESQQRITYPNYRIIVVNNGSADDSARVLNYWITNSRGDIADASSETLASARSDVSFKIIFSLASWVVD